MPNQCDPIRLRLEAVLAELRDLQVDLARATPEQKPEIVAQIRRKSIEVRQVREELRQCEARYVPPPPPPPPVPPLSMVHLEIYQHANFSGRMAAFSLSRPYRYGAVYVSSIRIPNESLSSFRLSVINNVDLYSVFFFEHDPFQGRFYRRDVWDPTTPTSVAFIGTDFNDITSSILLVRHATNEVLLSLTTILPPDLGDQIRNAFGSLLPANLRGVVSLTGVPRFTWAPLHRATGQWSSAGFGIDMRQRGHVHMENSFPVPDFDTDFEVSIKVRLVVANGRIQAQVVDATPIWVEESFLDQEVRDGLRAVLANASFRRGLADALSGLLKGVGWAGLREIYLLPGDSSAGQTTGSASTGLTLALVLNDD